MAARMSDTDTNTDLPIPQRSDSPVEKGVDLGAVYRDGRLDRHSEADVTARQGADEVIRRRKETPLGADYDFAESATDPISIVDADGTRTDRHSSFTQGDTRRVAEDIAKYREVRNKLAEDYLTAQYSGEESAAAEPTAEQQQTTEQELVAQQVAAQESQAEAARQQQQQRAAEAERVRLQAAREFDQARQQIFAHELGQAWQAEFPDVRTDADAIRLAQTDPARAARAQQLLGQYGAAAYQAHAQHIAQQQEHAQTEQWARDCKAHDDAFPRSHPEITPELKQEALDYLREDLHLSDAQIHAMYWLPPAQVAAMGLTPIRSAEAQAAILGNAKFRLAARKAKQITEKMRLPPVSTLRPGVSRDRSWVDSDRLAALGQQLETRGSVKAAAEYLKARRAASR
jgi:hypothetical protein